MADDAEILKQFARVNVANSTEVMTEGELWALLNRMNTVLNLPTSELERIVREISAEQLIHVDDGLAIKGRKQAPWLNDRRLSIDWTRSIAYQDMLRMEGRAPKVLASLDNDTNEILNLCGNPADESNWSRRGLVLGDVQAGKTGTYLSLMNKAADAGYRLFIVLGGHTEKLRSQTQERVDEGFVGRQGASLNQSQQAGSPIGIGKSNSKISPFQSLTTQQFDFGSKALKQFNLTLDAGLYVIVIKKNKRIFEALTAWLEQQRKASGLSQLKVPMMLLDDESDYASVNTKDPDQDPTAINDAIRKMLALFSRNTYVAFTATPFANIFIDHSDDDDLFPRDFIYALNTPSNYVGAKQVFGDDDADYPPGVQMIEDAEEEDHFPLRHKSSHHVRLLPDSCLQSIQAFFLLNAIRDLQPGGSTAPRSMLINVSSFMAVQSQVHDLVVDYVDGLRAAVALHARSSTWGRSGALRALQSTYEGQYAAVDGIPTWDEILAVLPQSIQGLRVALLNSRTSKTDTTIEDADRLIVVGGNVLSRGLTLKGLAISYFYRAPRASDTLLQMGRWFGYRDGYAEHCRLWIEPGVAHNFKQVQSAVVDLREAFAQMKAEGRTPAEFGLQVKYHPEALRVTATNKMRSAIKVPRVVSLFGTRCETTRLDASPDAREENWMLFRAVVDDLRDYAGEPVGSHHRWRDVGAELIEGFFAEYRPYLLDTKFQPDSLTDFIRRLSKTTPTWDVIVVSGADERLAQLSYPIQVSRRTMTFSREEPASVLVSGAGSRLAGRTDIRLAFDDGQFREYTKEFGGGNPPETRYYSKLQRPVLMLYPLLPKFKDQVPYDFVELPSVPFVAAKYALPTPDDSEPEEDQYYYLNTVAQEDLQWDYNLGDGDWEDFDDI